MKPFSADSDKTKYAMAKHHAWAGSILLAILLAIRVFFETTDNQINDIIFLGIGILLVLYILFALFFTYRYRTGLSITEEKANNILPSEAIAKEKIQSDLEKERLKLEKKRIKAEAKALKKQRKEEEKS
ncbi:MAG: hypothetical protein R6U21_02250 [Thermoplasmatota archaeon]